VPTSLLFWLNISAFYLISTAIGLAIVVGEQDHESGYLWVKFLVLMLLAFIYAGWIFIKFFKSTFRNFILYSLLMLSMGFIAICIFSVFAVKLVGL
jgi:hypothetical protein